MLNSRAENFLINDPVPKNVSKYPIHQTYLTDDAERTGTGGYKFKAPEVWSSARSGKKSIAIRSIQHLKKRQYLAFNIFIKSSGSNTIYTFSYSLYSNPEDSTIDILNSIKDTFNDNVGNFELKIYYIDNTLSFTVNSTDPADHNTYQIQIVDSSTETTDPRYYPSKSFNKFFNQPLDFMPTFADILNFDNVWDRQDLNFHASFIPFDNYQYLGKLGDVWQQPIIFQDPNTSPLFNIWITTDLKKPFPILHESFVIRITFIISSESQYHS